MMSSGRISTTSRMMRDFRPVPEREQRITIRYTEPEAGTLALVPALCAVRLFPNNTPVTLEALEQEYLLLQRLRDNEALWVSLSDAEKEAVERYRLILMQSTRETLTHLVETPEAVQRPEPAPQKTAWSTWLLFGSLLFLEGAPNLWGGFLGISSLLTIFSLPAIVGAGIGLALCGIQAVIYYAIVGPLLKDSLHIPQKVAASRDMEIASQQLDAWNDVDTLLTLKNRLSAKSYAGFARLATLFHRHLTHLTEYRVYRATRLADIEKIEDKAMVVIGNAVYFAVNGALVKTDGVPVSTTLTDKDLKQLTAIACDPHGRIIANTPQDNTFLVRLVKQSAATAELSDHRVIRRFEESASARAIIWGFGVVSTLINIGSGYFFALSLLTAATATAALVGTPIGWGIVSFVVLGQIALRFAVSSNAMTNLLNPAAERQKEIHGAANRLTAPRDKYQKVIAEKQEIETLRAEHARLSATAPSRERALQRNPYVDSMYPGLTQRMTLLSPPRPEEKNLEVSEAVRSPRYRH